MKKALIALALAFTMPMQSDAQFFKKLGKALGEVGKAVLESATQDGDTQTKSTLSTKKITASCGATIKNAIPDISVDVVGAGQSSDGIFVVMTLTNTSSKTQSFVFVGVKASELVTTPANTASNWSSQWKLGDHDWYHFGQEFNGSCWDYQIGAGEKIDAWLMLKNFSPDITMINNMRLSARLGGTSYYVGEEEKIYYVDISNLTVKPLKTYSSKTSTSSSNLSAFVSSDLKLNDLRGKVKSVIGHYDETNENDGYEYGFSQSGTWTNVGTQTLKQYYNSEPVQRNAKGQLIRLCSGDMGLVERTEYTYNAQGFVTKKSIDYGMDGSSIETYTYDANGDVVKKACTECTDSEGSDKTTSTVNYTILNRDSKGNWTRRKVVDSNGSRVEKRRINYWQ